MSDPSHTPCLAGADNVPGTACQTSGMNATRSGGGPEDGDSGSWASETLPMNIRKELLERELKKLGFRKAEARRTAAGSDTGGGQQDGQTSHPQADSDGQHGD